MRPPIAECLTEETTADTVVLENVFVSQFGRSGETLRNSS
jgi:hypothetical protein